MITSVKNKSRAANCKELFDISIGITLCKKCHSIIDEYRKIKTT
jgi:hypothetical protein